MIKTLQELSLYNMRSAWIASNSEKLATISVLKVWAGIPFKAKDSQTCS
jgi:hypothetical protein